MAELNRTSKNQTAFQKELDATKVKVKEYKTYAEAMVVSILYKEPETLLNTNLTRADFSENKWGVYFTILYELVKTEGKPFVDDMSIGGYLKQHSKLKAKYDRYGGYKTIEQAKTYVNEKNLEGYINDLRKWNVVLKLADKGFPVTDNLSDYADMSAEDIYDEFEAFLNHTFINIDSDIKSYNACEGINEMIDKLNEGSMVGLELYNAPLLTNEIAGLNPGHIYGLGAGSGVGKSTMAFNYLVPSAIYNKRRVVFIINEEDQEKFKREMLVWVANNVYKDMCPKDGFQKYILRNGDFKPEIMKLLRECAKWIEDKKDDKLITIIPLERYSVRMAIKIINKYSAIDPDTIFCLDTLKESFDANTDEIYKSMMRDMIALYDTIKPTNKNVVLFVTYQLGKQSIKLRHLTNAEIGQARSIVDVMSVNLMMRRPYDDEYEGCSKELKCYTYDDDSISKRMNGQQKMRKLKRSDNPMITFITKNRFGVTDQYQIVSSCDFGRNVCHDIYYCEVPQDY